MSRLFQVLLVEDDDPLRDVLMEVLQRRGWTVHAAGAAAQALEMARSVPVDFSLLDLHLPDQTGLDLLVRLRREIRPMPSIMMSGAASSADVEAALRAGVFGFLPKPLQLERLEATLDELVRIHFATPGRGTPPDGTGRGPSRTPPPRS